MNAFILQPTQGLFNLLNFAKKIQEKEQDKVFRLHLSYEVSKLRKVRETESLKESETDLRERLD